MNGPMREAIEKRVDWSHVDEDTFARLCEFGYLGDYTVPIPPPLPEESSDDEDWESSQDTEKDNDTVYATEEHSIDPTQDPIHSVNGRAEIFKERFALYHEKIVSQKPPLDTPTLFELLSKRHGSLKHKAQSAVHSFTLPRALESCEDFTPVLLAQARLYILGEKIRCGFAVPADSLEDI